MADFLSANGLENDVDPIQMQTRLWLYKGSPLLELSEVQDRIVQENRFNYEWKHRDPDVERVFDELHSVPSPGSIKRCCLKC